MIIKFFMCKGEAGDDSITMIGGNVVDSGVDPPASLLLYALRTHRAIAPQKEKTRVATCDLVRESSVVACRGGMGLYDCGYYAR